IRATFTPSWATRVAMASPIPRLPPDMNMTRFLSESAIGREPYSGLLSGAVRRIADHRLTLTLTLALAQQRQDVLRELVQEAGLVLAGRVQDQLVEAQVGVAADAGGDLLGVARDDEARGRSVDRLVGEPLHLDRVVHALLLLGRERQRCPPGARLAREVGVAVVGDLHLDHPPYAGRVAAGR